MRSLRSVAAALLVACAACAAAKDGRAADPGAAQTASARPITAEELERHVSMLLDATTGYERQAALHVVLASAVGAEEVLARRLASLQRARVDDMGQLVRSARATVGADGGDEALVVRVARRRPQSRGEAVLLETLALGEALARAGGPRAAIEVAIIGSHHGGALRREVEGWLDAMGEAAVPALVSARASNLHGQRQWATGLLEQRGIRTPSDCVQSKDPDVLATTLRAFGHSRDPDTVGVVISFIAAERLSVRKAAREALVNLGPIAAWKVRESLTALSGARPAEGDDPKALAEALFAEMDRRELPDSHALVDEAMEAYRSGDLPRAVARLDLVLARTPTHERSHEAASVYLAWGRSRVSAAPDEARAAFEKVVRLDHEGPRAQLAEAELAFLEGLELERRGVTAPLAYRRALALDPTHGGARAALERAESAAREAQTRARALALGAAAALAVFVAALSLRPRRARSIRAR